MSFRFWKHAYLPARAVVGKVFSLEIWILSFFGLVIMMFGFNIWMVNSNRMLDILYLLQNNKSNVYSLSAVYIYMFYTLFQIMSVGKRILTSVLCKLRSERLASYSTGGTYQLFKPCLNLVAYMWAVAPLFQPTTCTNQLFNGQI